MTVSASGSTADASPRAVRGRLRGRLRGLADIVPGILLAAAVAVAATLFEPVAARLAAVPFGAAAGLSAMVLALLLGILLNPVAQRPVFRPGLTFCVKKVLRWAVALLGLRVAVGDVLGLGWQVMAIVVGGMTATLVAGVVMARLFGRSDAYGALVGSATAVCGASAALATVSVLPEYRERDADVAFVVVAVNALATLAMLLYPPLAAFLRFDDRMTGALLGAAIHDVAQVAGAGYAVSEVAGNTAVVVKLFRVFLLLPVVLAVAFYFAGRGGGTARARVPVPVFALVFLALVLVNSYGLLPAAVTAALNEASRAGLLLAIAALGLGTSPRVLASLGWQHVAIVAGATLVILAVSAAGLALLA